MEDHVVQPGEHTRPVEAMVVATHREVMIVTPPGEVMHRVEPTVAPKVDTGSPCIPEEAVEVVDLREAGDGRPLLIMNSCYLYIFNIVYFTEVLHCAVLNTSIGSLPIKSLIIIAIAFVDFRNFIVKE